LNLEQAFEAGELRPRERQVLRRRLRECQAVTARSLGLSRQYVQQVERRALQKLGVPGLSLDRLSERAERAAFYRERGRRVGLAELRGQEPQPRVKLSPAEMEMEAIYSRLEEIATELLKEHEVRLRADWRPRS
jgi:hypothetical protein